MIKKSEMTNLALERDIQLVQSLVAKIDYAVRSRWKGQAINVDSGAVQLPQYVVDAVFKEVTEAGWTITYSKGGNDQRDGDWNGNFTVG